jgi:hypothetical protein
MSTYTGTVQKVSPNLAVAVDVDCWEISNTTHYHNIGEGVHTNKLDYRDFTHYLLLELPIPSRRDQ